MIIDIGFTTYFQLFLFTLGICITEPEANT